MNVELIYDADCPNVAATRSVLITAFTQTGTSARWKEWERSSPGSPAYAQSFGSPTILVDGRDVSSASAMDGSGACRIYVDASGRLSGVPPLEDLIAALTNAAAEAAPLAPARAATLKQSLPALPAIGLALFPKLTCPLCWPAYTALLSALGLGFFDYTPYLAPLITAFLVLTLIMLAYRAGSRRGYAPFALGIVASAIVLVGKFALDSDMALYGGITLLIGASLWNAWPKRAASSCPACITATPQSPA